ncbi:AMSH-like ubiquitin thioesterase 2 [Cocos nucifera]|uniref:AMSH-like ubiquitin thioesterase 2 n=1 Tax=Cocos nucifera TaxID=13894 RepID=A0A8K0N3A3_COCNU|nr:AMSH-like ubiquitin thioesterase 2 [Cocos nucifera]
MSEIIPQPQSYSKYPKKEKLHHKKILQEFSKELEKLKTLFGRNNNEIGNQLARRSKNNKDDSNLTSQRWIENNEEKVSYCRSVRTCNSFDSNAFMGSINLESGSAVDANSTCTPLHVSFPMALAAARDHDSTLHAVGQYSPSPAVSWIEDLPLVGQVSHVIFPEKTNEDLVPVCGESSTSTGIHNMHISVRLMGEFMELAKDNTDKNLETCGILGAFLNDQTFYVTTLIIPKQESTSGSCQALNEEEIHAILDEQSLLPAGWIHTHPSQTCFLSSIDLHTQYSYQVMLPEAVAIVMAPTDPARNYGIFRLTDPGGITVLKGCEERGFHPHPGTADGGPIYENCSHVYINPNLRFEIIDLRSPYP